MSAAALPILGWTRSAVAPVGGALSQLAPHEIGAPLLQALLRQTGLPPSAIDAVVLGNALGGGGNPARMLALAAGLPDSCAAHSVDTQCCSGLDAVALAAGLLHSGQAEVVVAGGVEAWSRAPIRQTRPRHAGEAPKAYERPPFAPDPARDPEMLQSAADYALTQGYTRDMQEAYAIASHMRALELGLSLTQTPNEITPVAGLQQDSYPRHITPSRAARMPLVAQGNSSRYSSNTDSDSEQIRAHGLSALTISAKADGAALLLLATPAACAHWQLQHRAQWLASASVGAAPETPLLAAIAATRQLLQRGATVLQRPALSLQDMACIELHDAFAVQGLAFEQAFHSELGPQAERLNAQGGGLARGHPIGASGAIALVRCLSDLQAAAHPAGSLGMAAIAGAGGIGAATLVQCLNA